MEAKQHFGSYGIKMDGLSYDFAAVQAQKDGVVSGLTKGIEGLFKKNKVRGAGGFEGAGEGWLRRRDGTGKERDGAVAAGLNGVGHGLGLGLGRKSCVRILMTPCDCGVKRKHRVPVRTWRRPHVV